MHAVEIYEVKTYLMSKQVSLQRNIGKKAEGELSHVFNLEIEFNDF